MSEFNVPAYYTRIITHLVVTTGTTVYKGGEIVGRSGAETIPLKLEEAYCTLCGAIVPLANQPIHTDWHRKIHESLLPPY